MPKLRKSRNSNDTANEDDGSRSFDQWMLLSHPNLVLKCGEYNLPAKGKKNVLAKRLCEFHQQQKENAAPGAAASPADVLTFGNNSQSIKTDFTIQSAPNPTVKTTPIIDNTTGDNAVTNALCEAVSSLQEQQVTIQGALNQVLSQLGNQQAPSAQQTQQQPTPNSNPNQQQQLTQFLAQTTPNNLIEYNPNLVNNPNALEPVHGFNSQQLLLNPTGASTFPGAETNPYLPPPMSQTVANKIKNLQFVDFHELINPLLPSAANMSGIAEGADEGLYHLTQSQVPGAPVSFKKHGSRSPITSFSNWIVAWNTFYEATLHYHPHMHSELFAYLKHISNFATKHKFEYLLAYDKTHRMQIAAQRSLGASRQSASWTKYSDTLFNTYLRNNPKPQCNRCFSYDHMEKRCPLNNAASPISFNQTITPTHQWSVHHTLLQQQQQQQQHLQQQQQHQQILASPSQFRNVPPHEHRPSPQLPVPSVSSQRPSYCFRFNRNERCRPTCQYVHRCSTPGCDDSGHNKTTCPKSLTTGFRPNH